MSGKVSFTDSRRDEKLGPPSCQLSQMEQGSEGCENYREPPVRMEKLHEHFCQFGLLLHCQCLKVSLVYKGYLIFAEQ